MEPAELQGGASQLYHRRMKYSLTRSIQVLILILRSLKIPPFFHIKVTTILSCANEKRVGSCLSFYYI